MRKPGVATTLDFTHQYSFLFAHDQNLRPRFPFRFVWQVRSLALKRGCSSQKQRMASGGRAPAGSPRKGGKKEVAESGRTSGVSGDRCEGVYEWGDYLDALPSGGKLSCSRYRLPLCLGTLPVSVRRRGGIASDSDETSERGRSGVSAPPPWPDQSACGVGPAARDETGDGGENTIRIQERTELYCVILP